jgi:hypothetical protein
MTVTLQRGNADMSNAQSTPAERFASIDFSALRADAIHVTRPEGAIIAEHYRTEVDALMRDEIIRGMLASIPADTNLDDIHMVSAMNEYNRRGGANAQSIGGVKWALRALRAFYTSLADAYEAAQGAPATVEGATNA